ncbi:MAG TPA: hypothetical protein VF072_06995 [Thermoleophilaceae bacterium]
MSARPRETHIPIGPLISAIGGILLIVSLGLDWYGDFSAFTAFEVWDLVLVVLGLLTLAALAIALGLLNTPLRPGTGLAVGAAALIIVLTQLINHPPAGIDLDEGTGLWLGLGGSALMLLGAVLSTARIAISVEPRGRGATVTTGGPAPEAPARPPAGGPPPPDEEPTIRAEAPPRP